MEEIIKQIAQIDSVAVSNKENSEQALKDRREQYEKEIIAYREETLTKAKERAEELYNEIIMTGKTGNSLETEKSRKTAVVTQNKYFEIEPVLLNEVFNEIFRVEG